MTPDNVLKTPCLPTPRNSEVASVSELFVALPNVVKPVINLACTVSGLLLYDFGGQRWQSCNNYYDYSQILTFFSDKLQEKTG